MSALGKIAYHSVFRPFWFCAKFFSRDGFVEKAVNRRCDAAMKTAAAALPPLPPPPGGAPYAAHFLTNGTFFSLSSFAAYSLQYHTGGRVSPVFHSDGRLDAEAIARFRAVFPAARFVANEEQRDLLATHLPEDRFPALNRAWREFVLIRKLVSVHLGRRGWNLFIDSDTLFWRRPDFVLDWFAHPARAFCMEDMATVYGYDESVLARLAGAPIPARVNSGLVGIQSESIDWDFLERGVRELIAVSGINHFMEQGLTAVLLARQPFDYAPPADYFIPTRVSQCTGREGVFHHYAGPARNWLYRRAWRLFLDTLPAP